MEHTDNGRDWLDAVTSSGLWCEHVRLLGVYVFVLRFDNVDESPAVAVK